jgi:hypothetical protein
MARGLDRLLDRIEGFNIAQGRISALEPKHV